MRYLYKVRSVCVKTDQFFFWNREEKRGNVPFWCRNISLLRFALRQARVHFRIQTLVPRNPKSFMTRYILYRKCHVFNMHTSCLVNFAFTSGSHVWGIFSVTLAAFSFLILVLFSISISFQKFKTPHLSVNYDPATCAFFVSLYQNRITCRANWFAIDYTRTYYT